DESSAGVAGQADGDEDEVVAQGPRFEETSRGIVEGQRPGVLWRVDGGGDEFLRLVGSEYRQLPQPADFLDRHAEDLEDHLHHIEADDQPNGPPAVAVEGGDEGADPRQAETKAAEVEGAGKNVFGIYPLAEGDLDLFGFLELGGNRHVQKRDLDDLSRNGHRGRNLYGQARNFQRLRR